MTNPKAVLQRQRPPVAIMGVPFDNLTMDEAVGTVEDMIRSRQPHYFVTANLDFLAQSTQDVELQRILLEADLVVCDGTPPLWASRVLANPLVERVAGADLVPILIDLAARNGYRVFFLGATEPSAKEAVRILKSRYPRLEVDFYCPPFSALLSMDHEEMRRRVQAAKPDMLFVCLGCPKQEKWIWMHYRSLGVPVCAGVGATLDFLSGQFRRAPRWMRRAGLEWLHRLAQEPRRLFRRYVSDFAAFGRGFAVQCWSLRHGRWGRALPLLVDTESRGHLEVVRLHGDLLLASVKLLARQLAIDPLKDIILDISGMRHLDSTGLAWLIRLTTALRNYGHELIIVGSDIHNDCRFRRMKLAGFLRFAPTLMQAEAWLEAKNSERGRGRVVPAGEACLHWKGEVTAGNADQIWQETQVLLGRRSSCACTLDLAGVDFIDSTGLDLLMRTRRAAENRHIALRFTGFSPRVMNVVRFARMERSLLDGIEPRLTKHETRPTLAS